MRQRHVELERKIVHVQWERVWCELVRRVYDRCGIVVSIVPVLVPSAQ